MAATIAGFNRYRNPQFSGKSSLNSVDQLQRLSEQNGYNTA